MGMLQNGSFPDCGKEGTLCAQKHTVYLVKVIVPTLVRKPVLDTCRIIINLIHSFSLNGMMLFVKNDVILRPNLFNHSLIL